MCTSHMQAVRQRNAAPTWLPNEFTLYIRARQTDGGGVNSNSLVETQSGSFHTWLILPKHHLIILLLSFFAACSALKEPSLQYVTTPASGGTVPVSYCHFDHSEPKSTCSSLEDWS